MLANDLLKILMVFKKALGRAPKGSDHYLKLKNGFISSHAQLFWAGQEEKSDIVELTEKDIVVIFPLNRLIEVLKIYKKNIVTLGQSGDNLVVSLSGWGPIALKTIAVGDYEDAPKFEGINNHLVTFRSKFLLDNLEVAKKITDDVLDVTDFLRFEGEDGALKTWVFEPYQACLNGCTIDKKFKYFSAGIRSDDFDVLIATLNHTIKTDPQSKVHLYTNETENTYYFYFGSFTVRVSHPPDRLSTSKLQSGELYRRQVLENIIKKANAEKLGMFEVGSEIVEAQKLFYANRQKGKDYLAVFKNDSGTFSVSQKFFGEAELKNETLLCDGNGQPNCIAAIRSEYFKFLAQTFGDRDLKVLISGEVYPLVICASDVEKIIMMPTRI